MRIKLLALFIFCFVKFSDAQLWSEDIASIIYSKCSSCHGVISTAPFSLANYDEVSYNASDIESALPIGEMPPWPPDHEYSRFANERFLTQQQVNDILTWIDNGLPYGDTAVEPAPPIITTDPQITNPDLVLYAPFYNLTTGFDLYRCFVLPTGLSTNKYLTAIEALPGKRNIIQDIFIYSDTSPIPATLDAGDPDPGYTYLGGTGSSTSKLIGVWTPATRVTSFPHGMGFNLPANSNIILQVHYIAGLTMETDSSGVALKLVSGFRRDVILDASLSHLNLDNGPLFIPANTTQTFTSHFTLPYTISLLSVSPHMNLIGRSVTCYGVTPSGDTIHIIKIPKWDFHWQEAYSFPQPLKVPAGTTIYSEVFYDNTDTNDFNPNHPPLDVTVGSTRKDEMFRLDMAYAIYLPGDESIIVDSSFVSVENVPDPNSNAPQLFNPVPNPASENVIVEYYLPKISETRFSITDLQGRTVKVFSENNMVGLVSRQLNISDLLPGIYFLTLEADGILQAQKLIKE